MDCTFFHLPNTLLRISLESILEFLEHLSYFDGTLIGIEIESERPFKISSIGMDFRNATRFIVQTETTDGSKGTERGRGNKASERGRRRGDRRVTARSRSTNLAVLAAEVGEKPRRKPSFSHRVTKLGSLRFRSSSLSFPTLSRAARAIASATRPTNRFEQIERSIKLSLSRISMPAVPLWPSKCLE